MPTPKTASTRTPPPPPVPAPAEHVPDARWVTRVALRSEFGIVVPSMTLKRWEAQGRFPPRHSVDG